MTTYWAEHALLPEGVAYNVRLTEFEGRWSAIEPGVQRGDGEGGGQGGVGLGAPDGGIDAVDDAADALGAGGDQTFQPHAILHAVDFLGIGRADRGNRVGRAQARLQIADLAIIFDAVDRPCFRRQA